MSSAVTGPSPRQHLLCLGEPLAVCLNLMTLALEGVSGGPHCRLWMLRFQPSTCYKAKMCWCNSAELGHYPLNPKRPLTLLRYPIDSRSFGLTLRSYCPVSWWQSFTIQKHKQEFKPQVESRLRVSCLFPNCVS